MWYMQQTFPTSIYAYSEVSLVDTVRGCQLTTLQLVTGVGAWNRDPSLFLTKPFGYSSFAHEIASAPECKLLVMLSHWVLLILE